MGVYGSNLRHGQEPRAPKEVWDRGGMCTLEYLDGCWIGFPESSELPKTLLRLESDGVLYNVYLREKDLYSEQNLRIGHFRYLFKQCINHIIAAH